jgi:hypothetical protein
VRSSAIAVALSAAAWLAVCCCPTAQAVTLVSPPAGAVVQSQAAATFTVGLDAGETSAQVVLVRQRFGAVGLDDPLWESGWDAESPFAADGVITWVSHLRAGFYSYRACAKSAASEAEDLDCFYGDQIRTIEVRDGAEAPCRGTYGGGFYREISMTNTSCDKARGVVRSWVRRSGFGKPNPKFRKRLDVGAYRCTLAHFGGRKEGAYDRITCKASKGRRVKFYGSP